MTTDNFFCEEDAVGKNDVPERLAESLSVDFVSINEVGSVATCWTAQQSSTFPIDQVPNLRDTIDCTNEKSDNIAPMAALTDCHASPSQYAQMKMKPVCTTQQQHSANSKDPATSMLQQCLNACESQHCTTSPAAMTIPVGDCSDSSLLAGINQSSAGCKSCGCTRHPNPSSKSEALCQVNPGEIRARAGADPHSNISPEAIFSVSVISSSSCGTAEPPSLATSHGAEQGINAMFASHLGSSSSNSLSNCAQSHNISFTAITTINDVEPTHVTQAIESPYSISSQVQNKDKFLNIVKQSSINVSSVDVQEETSDLIISTFPHDLNLDINENKNLTTEVCDEKVFTGALLDQDNNSNKFKNFSRVSEEIKLQQQNQTINEETNFRSLTPLINIPKSQSEVSVYNEVFSKSANNSKVQGDDIDPPKSFNTINNKDNNYNSDEKSICLDGKDAKSIKLTTQSATDSESFYACKPSVMMEPDQSMQQIRLLSKANLTYLDGPATNARWGIPLGLGLRGGGESSLNSGTSSWVTPQSGNSNNSSNNSGAGGWGGNSQGQSGSGPPNQWGSNNNVNRNSGSSSTSQGNSNQQNTGQPPSQQQPGSSQAQPQQSNSNQQQTNQSQAPQAQQQQVASQQQQQNSSTSWAQAAGKGLPTNPQGSSTSSGSSSNTVMSGSSSGSSTGPTTSSASGSSTTSKQQQLEQLNTMREALFSQDGWGGQHVNQDTGWDIPPSPEPSAKDGVPVWKPNVNNGTDLWEANLRNGGQPPPSQTQKTPWGHTPTTNIGGTWGEDDDADSSSMWTGVPSNTGPGTSGGQWTNSAGASGGMWGAPKKDSDWGVGAAGSNWGDPRDPRGDPRTVPGVDIRGGNSDPRELRGGNMMDPREHMRGVVDPMRNDVGIRDIRGIGEIRGPDAMLRGDPRGISGRINGASNDGTMWSQHPQTAHHPGQHHQQNQPPGKMVGPGTIPGGGVNQWPGPPPKDMGLPGAGTKPSGWEEPSPPAQRRNIPNYDDGTSLWGNPSQQQNRIGKVSHWKEMPTPNMGRGGMQCPPGMPQSRMPGNTSSNMKADGTPLWAHPGRNGSWPDGPHEASSAGWGDDSKVGSGSVNSWSESPLTPTSWGGPKAKNPLNPNWVDGDMDTSTWTHPPKQGPKPLTKDIVWSSKQFRILSEMGFKKEDIETALRSSNMIIEDAHELLINRLGVEAWRRNEDHSPFDLPANHPGGGFPGQRFNPVAQQMPFAPPGPSGAVNNVPGIMNPATTPNISINNMSPAIVQKILTQQPPPQQPPSQQQSQFNQVPRAPQTQPSTAQLRMLVQQIQMAVQAGYLNHQILNQPLAPQTLILLNQLLQQIKVLQQLMVQQQAVVQVQPHKGSSSNVLQISVQITKTKQQITNLQNQIASQQAIYVKQQQQQQQQHHHHMNPQGTQPNDFFKPSMQDPLAALQNNFADLTINKEQQVQTPFQTSQQQSRLNQWKLPSLDKDNDGANNEFSRAPGTTTKSSLPPSHSSPNINPLLGPGDGTWSTVTRPNTDTGWPDTSNADGNGQGDSKDPWPVAAQSGAPAFTDLVPEFEPGKPWKGTQMKSIEDDPSLTPGSVVRSPLSLPTIKDTEIFNAGSKTSPTVSSAVDSAIPSLSSSTWSFNPPPQTSSMGKLGGSKNTWGDAPPPTTVTSELWGAPMVKSRGPPPGLSNKGGANSAGTAAGANSANGWGTISARSSSWGIQSSSWGSTWLLLKNLTPQIDGSTLKTLCVQHGPLLSFHLYLNHGIALAKYSSREEANKAQGALNNCVLGNTTIFAESPGESDVHSLLQHLGHGAQQQAPTPAGSTAGWGLRGAGSNPPATAAKASGPTDTWAPGGSQLWTPNPSSNSLWAAGGLDSSGEQHRATPSSLNSFLPGDLLGGESM